LQTLENALALGEISGIVADGALPVALDGEIGRKRQSGAHFGAGGFDLAGERQRGCVLEAGDRLASIRLNRLSVPDNGLLVVAQQEFASPTNEHQT
jgi:hypothetical protein